MAAKPRPVSPKYPKISDSISSNVHKALSGSLSPEDAVANIQKEVEAIVK
jgi:multiple sugar transport system substrate-binding protein